MKRYEAPTCQVIEMMGESLLAGSGDNENVRKGRGIDLGDEETYTKSPSSVPIPTWLASLLTMLFVVSCGNDDAVPDPQPETKPAKVHLTFEAYPEGGTRSALSGDGDTKQIIWNANDAISVLSMRIDEDVCEEFTLQSGQGTTHGTFVGETLERDTYYALYPYQEQATFDKGQFKNVVLPAVQTATAGTYDPHASLAVATCQPSNSQTLELKFRNVCSYVAITPEYDCKSLTVCGKNNEDLAGIISINYNNGTPTANVTEGSKTVTLVGDIQANETYYIAVLPQTLEGGFTVTVQDGDKYKRVGTTTAFTLTRSQYHDVGIGAAPTKEAFVDLGLSVKWATMNLNASAAEQPGNYYAWGEAVPLFGFDAANTHGNYKTTCSWESYKWSDGTSTPSITGGFNDAATLALGDGVSIPTEEQWQELIENCTWTLTERQGYTVTGANGKSIFLPLTGFHNDKSTTQATETCYYWSATVDGNNAISLQLNSSKEKGAWRVADGRRCGFAIRPVKG